MASFTAALTQKPDEQTQLKIAQTIFEPDLQAKDLLRLKRYFTYYERELALLNLGKPAQMRQSIDLATKTHVDILFVVQELRGCANLTRYDFRERVRARFSDADDIALDRSIDLSLRLWMMINAREPRMRLQAPQTPVLNWAGDATFEEFIAKTFPKSRWQIGAKDSRLHPLFTAAFMVKICGLQLEWTDCLVDHLRLDRRQKVPVLRIYSDKSFLQYHLNAVQANATASTHT